jgi:hypothetical protein
MIILDKEHEFLLKLIEELGDKYEIIKSQNKYCNIDFIVINRHNLKTLYIEHKFRNVVDKYDTLFIGKTKINNILSLYSKCVIVWEFIGDVFYSIEVCDDMLVKYYMAYVMGSYALEISKEDCNKSIDNLIENIIKNLEI